MLRDLQLPENLPFLWLAIGAVVFANFMIDRYNWVWLISDAVFAIALLIAFLREDDSEDLSS
jgi:hypothetical protein